MSRSLDLLTDACAALDISAKKMFGGHGFFAPNGGMFAGIVTDDEVILKLALGPVRDELIALGGRPWVYESRGKAVTMQEWIVVPDSFFDDQELFSTWTARAHRLAPAKTAAKKKSPAKKTGRTPPRRPGRATPETKSRR